MIDRKGGNLKLLLIFLVPVYGDSIIGSLLNTNWTVTNSNLSISVPARVPGGIYSDLRNAGILGEDILYRFNDVNYRWVARDNWTYSTKFDVDPIILEKEHVLISFYGVDTISSICLNDKLLGYTSNMFVRYSYEVKNNLMLTNNSLVVVFTSPIKAASQYAKESEYEVLPSCVPQEYNGECHANYLRKMQASFAWDWGPAFPSVGLWKNIALEAYDSVLARYVSVKTVPGDHAWTVTATMYGQVSENYSGSLQALLILDPDQYYYISFSKNVTLVADENGEFNCSLEFTVYNPYVSKWWPNGYGQQHLYDLSMNISDYYYQSHVTVRIGFRTVELVQEDIDSSNPSKGLSYYFKVNDVPIFAKGSNYIPANILPELSSNETVVSKLLKSAKDANMNMLRVWGGGLYESDYFYKLCDEMGILIWQDMAFACSMYPASDEFLLNVGTEVKQQVLRLQSHPSLCVWAGNNENEAALRGNWYGTSQNFSRYKADYVKLYVDTIRTIVLQYDNSRPFTVSSPSNGLESEAEGYIAKDPYSSLYGDDHYYNYYANLWSEKWYPKTRFGSEYGIMSLPSLDTLGSAALPEDLTVDSEFISHRQHHLAGYFQLLLEISINLPPIVTNDLDNFIYMTQINQAMSIKLETEYYRRQRNTITKSGEGMTMGALYWQLNDVWQAPSWSSIEYGGKWKMLHYYARDFFNPVLVSPVVNSDDQLQVSLVSDLKDEELVKLVIDVVRWDTLGSRLSRKYNLKMAALNVTDVNIGDIVQFLSRTRKCGKKEFVLKNCFLTFTLLQKNSNKQLGPTNFLFPIEIKSVFGLKNATIDIIGIVTSDNFRFVLTLRTDTPAIFVWVDAQNINGQFSENGFHFIANDKTVVFKAESKISMDQVLNSIVIRSLGGIPQSVNMSKVTLRKI
uniref:Beta-mannosidase n=1 Tax=Clastoptera arizonana TaxID=38151 RepID=A0A1B6CRS8_9HEMI